MSKLLGMEPRPELPHPKKFDAMRRQPQPDAREDKREPVEREPVDQEASLHMELLAKTDAKLEHINARLESVSAELSRWKQGVAQQPPVPPVQLVRAPEPPRGVPRLASALVLLLIGASAGAWYTTWGGQGSEPAPKWDDVPEWFVAPAPTPVDTPPAGTAATPAPPPAERPTTATSVSSPAQKPAAASAQTREVERRAAEQQAAAEQRDAEQRETERHEAQKRELEKEIERREAEAVKSAGPEPPRMISAPLDPPPVADPLPDVSVSSTMGTPAPSSDLGDPTGTPPSAVAPVSTGTSAGNVSKAARPPWPWTPRAHITPALDQAPEPVQDAEPEPPAQPDPAAPLVIQPEHGRIRM
jgi:hypothetical protein